MAQPAALNDPLHRVSGPGIAWTRVNIAEGIPGVSTPLNWSHWDDANERMIRQSYHDMGILSTTVAPPPDDVDHRTSSIFFGRVALNVDLSRQWADLQPGTSGDALEEHYFGSVRPGVESNNSRRRYPVVFLKTPVLFARTPRWLRRVHADNERFWRQAITESSGDAATAFRRFVEARERFHQMARPHTNVALLCGPLFQQLGKTLASVDKSHLMLTLFGGHESIEIETTADLWAVSRDRLSIAEFLARRGFQGPAQGQMSSRSWRDDPAPVERLVSTLRSMDDGTDPRVAERARVDERIAAERELVAALVWYRRPYARLLLRATHTYVPLREIGKAGLMQMLDAMRAQARVIGAEWARRGLLDDPEDVFFLTVDELLTAEVPSNVTELVAFRRARYDEYLAIVLPESWLGMVEPRAFEPAGLADAVSGVGVSPGVAEGIVRVLLDPSTGDLEPGEILVCETTDPSYAPYFLVAAGCVIDIGGALSHGAIVAREVGIPCVINTRTGTRTLHTGDVIRIDGSTGSVEILERSERI